jgi:hypothetical protein
MQTTVSALCPSGLGNSAHQNSLELPNGRLRLILRYQDCYPTNIVSDTGPSWYKPMLTKQNRTSTVYTSTTVTETSTSTIGGSTVTSYSVFTYPPVTTITVAKRNEIKTMGPPVPVVVVHRIHRQRSRSERTHLDSIQISVFWCSKILVCLLVLGCNDFNDHAPNSCTFSSLKCSRLSRTRPN